MADMMVQMKIPAEMKAIDRYLLAVYLQGEKKGRQRLVLLNLKTLLYLYHI